ncbi:MAG TPA: hypothetical protein VLB07_11385 [Woeseiaceae bacterium]|nr:hypothetical protein [Woeseiaceae bacterium]
MANGKGPPQTGPSGDRRHKSPSYVQRVTERVRESADLGRVLVTRPRSFPSAVWVVIRRWIRKVWDTRGGGLYACGFVVAFAWLEVTTLADDFSSSTGVTGFFGGQLLQFLLRFTIDSMVNTVLALIWPVQVVAYSPPWGALGLGAMYLAFPYILKKPLERWLFDDAGAVAEEPPAANPDTGKD